MPRLTKQLPTYRLHKPSGQAVVTFDRRDHYLGVYNSPESRAEHDRVMAEWLAGWNTAVRRAAATPLGGMACNDLTVNEVLAAFWEHAKRHYRAPDGRQSNELNNFHDTFRPIRKLYGTELAAEFSPLKLKRVRQAMIDDGLCRNTINQRIGRIVHTFKWAVSEELIPAAVDQAIKTVSGLQRGRTDARESEPVRPVPAGRINRSRKVHT